MGGRRRVGVIALLALAASLATVPLRAVEAERYRSSTRRLAPGVRYTRIYDPSGPWRIKVVSIRMSAPSSIDVALSNDRLAGFEQTSSIARRHGALVAINGDYALASGRPAFAFAKDGQLAQTGIIGAGSHFSVAADESAFYFGRHEVVAAALDTESAQSHRVRRVNDDAPWSYDPPRNSIAQFTMAGAGLQSVPGSACAARLYPLGGAQLTADGGAAETAHYVQRVVCREKRLTRKGGAVLAAPIGTDRAATIASWPVGQTVTLTWSMGWDRVLETIGGHPILIENFAITPDATGGGTFYDRHPRTGVGATSTGKILFVVVDGRRPGWSVGMTPREFARLFASLGAQWAMNLDGGGSSTMVVQDRVVNRPSDRSERPVSSALLLHPGGDGDRRTTAPAMRPSAGGAQAGGSEWDLVVHDPASTGGMADAVSRSSPAAPRELRAAAAEFRR